MASSDQERQIANLSPAKRALLAQKMRQSGSAVTVRPRKDPDAVPLSFAQQRIWLIHELDPDSHLYNVPRALELTGRLDRAALESSLNEIIRRHEALRTTFRVESGRPVQIIAPDVRIALPVTEVPTKTGVSPKDIALDLALEEYRRPFDLSAGPVLRARLWRLQEEQHLLLLVMHHIVSDGWSGGVLFDELGILYEAFSEGRPSPLAKLPVQYADFAVWQRNWLERFVDKEIEYWSDRLAGAAATLELPTDHPRPREASFRGHSGSLKLPPDLSHRVISFSQTQGVTLFTVMLAGLQILLYRWTGHTDLVVGTVNANRNTAEVEKLIGCFMNFLVLRERVQGSENVLALLARSKKNVLEAFAHQDCPFEKVVEAVNPERASNVNPLYNVALLMQNYPAFAFRGKEIEARFLPFETQVAFLDIRFMATESGGELLLECECNSDLFNRATVDLLLAGYRDVLEQIVEQPSREVDEVRISDALARQAQAGSVNRPQSIAIAATFTAGPVQQALDFWMKRLGIPTRVQFAPYNQVTQQLLDPSSHFSSNRQGINVVLLRVEDLLTWEGQSSPDSGDGVASTVGEFVNSFRISAQRSKVPYLVCMCPPSAAVRAQVEVNDVCERTQALLALELSQMPVVSVITPSDLLGLYPVGNYDDEYAWQVGHIPYTPAMFTALATMIARRICMAGIASHQVMVVDCDQTLWKTDCEEQGALGVEVDPPRRVLQEFLIAQQETGMILCLCSKRSEEFIDCLLEQNPAMRLRSQHIADTRINQQPHSENLKDFAREFELDLAGFIFVSTDPLACAEVRANCPAVMVAQLPADAEQIPHYLSHFWGFDRRPGADGVLREPLLSPTDQFAQIAAQLSTVEAISQAIESDKVLRATRRSVYAAPRTAVEELLVDVWARLLSVDQPGIRDNFFALGGHSLLAVQVVARIRQLLDVEMPLRAMFDAPTIAEFAERVEAARGARNGLTIPPLKPAPRQGQIPLSYAQQRLWFIDQLEPGNPLYNISAMYGMWGLLHVEALQKTINEIVRRHESLRTTFRSVDGLPVQVIAPELRLSLRLAVREGLFGKEREQEIWRFAREEALRPFDLSTGPLVRFSLLKVAEDEHALVVILHHIVGDGWSGGLLAAEMAALYEAFIRNRPSPLPELSIQYADFAAWQRQWMQGEVLDAQLAYWRQHLAGAPAVLELPTDHPRPAVQEHHGAMRTTVIPRKLLERLRALSQAEGATLFMTLLAAFQLLLSRYSGQEDIVVGSTVAGRNYSEIEPLIGFFVKTLALRTNLSGEPTFRELLARVKQVALDGYAHQEIPFEKLVEELQPERSLSYNPIFQVLFGLQNLPKAAFEVSGLRVERAAVHPGTSLFDMSWLAFETVEGLLLRVEYNTDLFEDATIGRALDHFEHLLEGIVAQPGRRIAELPLLDEKERQQIVVEFNSTAVEYPLNTSLHQFFEAQVERTPDATALIFEEQRLSYSELNCRANQLAHHVRKLGIGPDDLVGVCAHRSIEMVVALYGIVKAGAAYVPLDPEYPQERLAGMVEDAGCKSLLTQERLLSALPPYSGQVIALDRDWPELATEPTSNPAIVTRGKNLAYAIYTSGSTGKPKGVPNVHEGIVNRLLWMQDEYQLGADDRVLQKTPYSFDVSVWEFFWPLMTGATLVVAKPDGHKDPSYLVEIIRQKQITTLHFVPSMLQIFLQSEGVERCQSLRRVFCSGEALSYEVQQQFFKVCGAELHNLYGPTEAAVDVTYWQCRPDYSRTLVPIGRPVANTQIYLLDQNLEPVPIGVAGELHIGGIQLARGYLNRPELTAEKFIRDPFSSKPGARLYKTGDLARFLPDGNIEYLGRIDHQVKIRGFRIELGEIEAALDRHAAVRQSVVMAREDEPGDKRLVAYIVPEGEAPAAEDLRSHLRAGLPEFMIPAAFVVLEAFPLSSNGKVNRRALPAPQITRSEEQAYVAPRNAAEEQIARIWAEVLRVPQVGVNDDFFVLGGHSLLATQVIARMRQAFHADLPLRSIFEAPSVAGLAQRVQQTRVDVEVPVMRAPRDRDLPLSFAQQRLWFLDQLEPDNPLYNIPWALRAHGELSAQALEAALNAMVERHEALRTTFPSVHGQPVQRLQPALRITLETTDLRSNPSEAQSMLSAEAKRPFDLGNGPLLRVRLLRTGEREHILLLNIHHIISDRWSMGVISQELASLYDALVQGKSSPLAPLEVQYADFAVWQRQRLQGEAYKKELAYWMAQLRDAPPVLELPTDRPRLAAETFRGAVATVRLSREVSEMVQALSREQGATLFMTLLAGFQLLLARYSGQDDIVIGAPIANRMRPEFEGLIGFFANTLPFRARLSGDPNFCELIERVKQTALGAYTHQDMPFEKLVEELRPERSLSHNPLVQVFFALQNAPMESLKLAGLRLEPIETDTKTAKGDLYFSLVETSDGLRGRMEYNTDLFDEATITRLLVHYQGLLEAAVADPLSPVSELPLLSAAERQQILVDWNATEFDYARQLCLHEVFEQQVERTPSAIACVAGGQSLTYSELNQRANQLAHFLKQRGAGPGQRIGLYIERSLLMMVGLLGIQKSGAAYVPLDPSYPVERVRLTLDDAQVPVLVTHQSLSSSMPEHQAEVVCLDSDWAKIASQPTSNPVSGATPEDLVYVIFTSGSTGRPKGVQVPHRAVVNLLTFMAKELRMGPNDVFPALASFAFDMCIPELYLALVTGGRVIIGDRHLAANGESLAETLRATGATIVHATPTTWNLLLEAGFTGAGMKRVIGAEALPRELCTRLLTADPSLYNFYGPTETTVWSAFHHFRSPEEPVVVGRPLANTQIYILDAHGQPVPVGVPGEIHIAGDGVTCGYLNRPELTAEKFIPDPFSPEPNARMYRTGDLGRYLADGRIEFQGRVDNQVKVRGYRIELGEIETVLGQHAAVQECVVIAREDVPGDKRLVGYVVPVVGQSPSVTDLRSWVKARLPEYMTPVSFVTMERFPLSPNGKVDRKHLPAPEYARPELSQEYQGPRTPTEEVIAAIWAEVLKLDQVGIEDDFFELGGHSLLGTQVISRIRQAFQMEVPLRALFEAPTIAGLASRVEAMKHGGGLEAPPITPVSRAHPLPLSFAQQRLWFLDQLEPNNPLYNVAYIVRLAGILKAPLLERAVNEIVRRHETLRTRFASINDEPAQVIAPFLTVPLKFVDLTTVPDGEGDNEARKRAMEEVKQPFQLTTGPLLRATLLKLSDHDHVLVLNTHHIISDRWSLGVLSQEMAAVYEAYLENKPSPLVELTIQYADYAVWQRKFLSGPALDQQLQYWKQQLDGAPPVLDLPTDRPRRSLENFWGGVHRQNLANDLVQDLRTMSRRHSATFFMSLLAGFQLLLARWSGQDDVVVGTDLANRTQLETEKLIGFFVNLLPIRARLLGDPTFEEILKQTREASLGAYAHQDLPFDKLVEELRPERKLTHNPLVQVLFVMQNTPPMVTEFGGLTLGPLGVSSTSRFDLVLFINDPDGTPHATWMYNPNLFDASTIARQADLYEILLRRVAAEPAISRSQIHEALERAERELRETEQKAYQETSLRKLKGIKRRSATASVDGKSDHN